MVVFDGGGGSNMGWICSKDGCGFWWGGGFAIGFLDLDFVAVSLAGFCGRWWWWVLIWDRFAVGVIVVSDVVVVLLWVFWIWVLLEDLSFVL